MAHDDEKQHQEEPPAIGAVRQGFNVILWRKGDLGYAVVSDADAGELGELAARIAGEP